MAENHRNPLTENVEKKAVKRNIKTTILRSWGSSIFTVICLFSDF
jgi:hypothetical protein